jgi:hypothetical protein
MGEKPYSFMCFYHYYHSKARRTMGIGTLDTAFSIDGKLDQNLGGDDIAVGTVIQGDGKIISIGITESRVSNQQSTNFYLRRYNRDGSDDTPMIMREIRLLLWLLVRLEIFHRLSRKTAIFMSSVLLG